LEEHSGVILASSATHCLMTCPAGRLSVHWGAMRKLMLPIALFLAGILVLVAAVYWYDHVFGSMGAGPAAGYR
jgi:hypothetical protein